MSLTTDTQYIAKIAEQLEELYDHGYILVKFTLCRLSYDCDAKIKRTPLRVYDEINYPYNWNIDFIISRTSLFVHDSLVLKMTWFPKNWNYKEGFIRDQFMNDQFMNDQFMNDQFMNNRFMNNRFIRDRQFMNNRLKYVEIVKKTPPLPIDIPIHQHQTMPVYEKGYIGESQCNYRRTM